MMDSDSPLAHPVVQQMLRTTRIIVISLVLGVSFFAGFVLVNPPRQPPNNGGILSLLAIPFVIVCVIMSVLVPRTVARRQAKALAAGRWPSGAIRRQLERANYVDDEAKLAMLYQTTTIIRAALLEGPLFFVLFAYWQEAQPWLLAVAATLLVLLMIGGFPRSASVERWLTDRLREIREHRELSGSPK